MIGENTPEKYDLELIEKRIHKWRKKVKEAHEVMKQNPHDAEARHRYNNYRVELQRWLNGGHYS